MRERGGSVSEGERGGGEVIEGVKERGERSSE